MKYRPLAAEDRETLERIHEYAFYPESGPRDPDDDRASADEASFGDPRALYEDGTVASVCRLLTFDATLRGETRAVGGLRGVATPPERRRRGHCRSLVAGALRECRDRGISLVALWPFADGFYESLGWATCTAFATYACPPASFDPIAERTAGHLRRLTGDDWAALDGAYRRARRGETLAMHRSENWWRHLVLQSADGDRYCYGLDREGSLDGYVVYEVDEGEDGRVLEVADLAAVDDEAFRNLCDLLAAHDSQVDAVRLRRRRDGMLLDRLGEPDAVTATLDRGPMVRAADPIAAIERTPVAEGADGSVVLEVDDELLDATPAVLAVRFEDGQADCEPAPNREPDVAVDVGTLSQILVGYRSPPAAVETGDLEGGEESLATLGAAYPTTTVELREFF